MRTIVAQRKPLCCLDFDRMCGQAASHHTAPTFLHHHPNRAQQPWHDRMPTASLRVLITLGRTITKTTHLFYHLSSPNRMAMLDLTSPHHSTPSTRFNPIRGHPHVTADTGTSSRLLCSMTRPCKLMSPWSMLRNNHGPPQMKCSHARRVTMSRWVKDQFQLQALSAVCRKARRASHQHGNQLGRGRPLPSEQRTARKHQMSRRPAGVLVWL